MTGREKLIRNDFVLGSSSAVSDQNWDLLEIP